jgi:hypothetical protein
LIAGDALTGANSDAEFSEWAKRRQPFPNGAFEPRTRIGRLFLSGRFSSAERYDERGGCAGSRTDEQEAEDKVANNSQKGEKARAE